MGAGAAAVATADELAGFFEQVDALVQSRAGGADTRRELALLGLLPTIGADAPWEELGTGGWYPLLGGVARRCPRLAVSLSGARLLHERGAGADRHGWAHRARRSDNGLWQLELPDAPNTALRWWFVDAAQLRSVSAARLLPALAQQSPWQVSCAHADCIAIDAAPIAGPDLAARDVTVLQAAVLWRMWDLAAAHAETRPMFRRHLADFGAVRARLVDVMGHVLEADELAHAIAMPEPGQAPPGQAGALRRAAQAVRAETQQLCGGAGYMRQSAFAEALGWCDWCDRVLRQAPHAPGALAPCDIALLERRVAARLGAAGVSEALAQTLARRRPQLRT